MPNLMVAMPNIGGTLYSTPQSLADAHYYMPCSNDAKTQNLLNFVGVPQTIPDLSQPLVRRSSPYYEDMWRIYCCLTGFFCDCRYVPQLRRYSTTKLCDGAQVAIFGDISASCIFSEPRAARFRPAS